MKVLLQNNTTRLFLEVGGSWTSKLDEAYAFINSGKAIDHAFEHKVADVHVLLWFKEQNYTLTIPFQRDHQEEQNSGPIPKPKAAKREQL